VLCGAGTVSSHLTASPPPGGTVPDQSQQMQSPAAPVQQGDVPTTGNPADTSANHPEAATSESVASNVNRVSEGQLTEAAQNIQGDPVVGQDSAQGASASDNYDDEEAWPYRALQHEAKGRDLDASGKRDEIIARLRESDGSQGQQESAPAPVNQATGGGAASAESEANGGIQRSARATRHAEILQRDSDERRQQQLAAARERSSQINNSADADDN
jgi:hypothetical protein